MIFQKPTRRFWWQLAFWLLVTVVFLYDRRYLAQKLNLPHFAECVAVRMALLMGLAYGHLYGLVPRFWKTKKYGWYGASLAGALLLFLTLQGAYDTYLFGFVVGDERHRNLLANLPYNAIATVWYLAVTVLLKLALDRLGEPPAPERAVVEPTAAGAETIWLKSGTRRLNVAVDAILYVQGLKDYSLVFTREGRLVAQGSLKAMEELLPAGQFVRVHKSFLVPVGSLKRFNRGQIELENVKIPVGRSYRKQVEGRLG